MSQHFKSLRAAEQYLKNKFGSMENAQAAFQRSLKKETKEAKMAKSNTATVAQATKPIASNIQPNIKTPSHRAKAPTVSPFNFTPGQAVLVTVKGKQTSGYTYIRSTPSSHVVKGPDGKECRIWFNYVFPA